MINEKRKYLPVFHILTSSGAYFKSKPLAMIVFSLLNYISVILGVYTWRTAAFFIVLIFAYALWCYFFRFYFNKTPYIELKSMTASLSPSTKILVLSFVIMTILILFPFILPFLGLGDTDYYMHLLNDQELLNAAVGVIGIFLAPFIFFRPFFAWIASALGYNKSLKFAFYHTQGNYKQIVCLLLILNIPYVLLEQISQYLALPPYLFYLLLSPLIVYMNIVMARCYEFFFIED